MKVWGVVILIVVIALVVSAGVFLVWRVDQITKERNGLQRDLIQANKELDVSRMMTQRLYEEKKNEIRKEAEDEKTTLAGTDDADLVHRANALFPVGLSD